ncbi:MAG: TraB/GumN family protein [Oceanisphaera sp.]
MRLKLLLMLLLWSCAGYGLAAPALWSAVKGEQQLWLFGSIHLADESINPLPQPLLESLAHSKHLYVEVDPSTLNPAVLAPYLTLPKQQTWSSRLGEPLATELKQQLNALNLAHLSGLPPWFAAMQLSQANAQRLGFSSDKGVDMQLLRLAQQQEVPISGLEPPTLVFELLSSLAERQLEVDFVRHTLAEQAELAEQLALLLTTWQTGDEQALLALLQDEQSPDMTAFIEQELLLARNQLWLENLARQAPSSALMVVGALHLYGEHGLLQLLRSAGYKITRN